MNQIEFILKRNQWLEDVSNQCHEYALKCDLDFYVFQTPVDLYNPDLLIIGINPGGGKPYSELLIQKGYSKRSATDLAYDVNTLTTKPQWEIEGKLKGNDVMRSSFSRVFTKENSLEKVLQNTVMMNMFYFNTPKEKDLSAIPQEMQDYCLRKTIEFIEILNPKNILFLTSDESKLKHSGIKEIKYLENNVKQGLLLNRTATVIPHYSYFGAYSKEKGALMGMTLRKLFK